MDCVLHGSCHGSFITGFSRTRVCSLNHNISGIGRGVGEGVVVISDPFFPVSVGPGTLLVGCLLDILRHVEEECRQVLRILFIDRQVLEFHERAGSGIFIQRVPFQKCRGSGVVVDAVLLRGEGHSGAVFELEYALGDDSLQVEHIVECVLARLQGDCRVVVGAVAPRHHHGCGGDVTSRGCDGIFLELRKGLPREVVEIDHRVLVVVGDRVHVPCPAVDPVELLLVKIDLVEPVGRCVLQGWGAKVIHLHHDRLRVRPVRIVEEDRHLLYFGLLLVSGPRVDNFIHLRNLDVE